MTGSLYATDLDWTLIFSERALAAGGDDPVEHEPATLVPVERKDGRDISFMTRRQLALLAAVERHCLVVPVTTRTLDQYRRVAVWAERPPPWAVAANGGILLRHGTEDAAWRAGVRAGLDGRAEPLGAVLNWLVRTSGRWFERVRVADDLFVVGRIDPHVFPEAHADDMRELLSRWGWGLSIQGRKLYAVPHGLRKSSAVREIAARCGAEQVIAAGDSLLDREMLDDADLSLRPAHGELHRIDMRADVVTGASGAAAGEELLATVLAHLTATEVPAAAGPLRGDEEIDGADGRVRPVARAELRAPPA